MLQIKVKRLSPEAIMPAFKTLGSIGFDLCALSSGRIDPPTITPVATGIALEIPEGYALFIVANTSNGQKAGVSIANGFSIIKSGKLEEISLAFSAQRPFKFFKGDKMAHGILLPVPEVEFLVDDSQVFANAAPGDFPEFIKQPF